MKRWVLSLSVLAVCLTGAKALAEGPDEEGVSKKADVQEHDVPGTIIEHVSDDYEYEFEIPWPDTKPIEVHLGKIFAPLQFEKSPAPARRRSPSRWRPSPG